MIVFICFLLPIIGILIILLINWLVKKWGKFSYDGFSALGFRYNAEADLFYATKNAWQKQFGYTRIYDVMCPLFNMILDVEPIKFFYNNKNWLITFWKGQYGITTGAEIGIYNTKQKRLTKNTVYLPINNEEMLNISFKLYKNEEILIDASAKHWWLAVFKLGEFSQPKDLKMTIKMEFLDNEMLEAFLKSFRKLGYTEKEYMATGKTFYFNFKHPKSKKVWTRSKLISYFVQKVNRHNVYLYQKYLANFIDDNGINDTYKNKKLIFVNEMIPEIFKNKMSLKSDTYE